MANAQTFKLTGRITDANREPVAFANVQVKELQSGTTTKQDGTYTLLLEEGKYDIIYSIVGYKSQVVTLSITKDYLQNIILEEDKALLENVTIKTKYKDRAVELIKNVIRRKDRLVAAALPWTCKVYIKAFQQGSSPDKKSKAKKGTVTDADRELAGMAMTEVSLKLDYASEQKIKEERLGVKKSGSSEDLFYLSSTEGFFN
ncbi:MAG TPA: carboxypeptidase-like regulatory domain-containing protein, partial [Segetibacter sp.]|nr:carboxypeptidase-like regulatory domain-containing protein [Segetibacter sp.]